MISAIALDLDGTLLNSNKQISNRNMFAIKKHISLGRKIIIATARPPRSVKMLVPEELLSHCSFVYYNGALVVDSNDQLIDHCLIDQIEVAEIIEYCITIKTLLIIEKSIVERILVEVFWIHLRINLSSNRDS